jgi:hypothetical protein
MQLITYELLNPCCFTHLVAKIYVSNNHSQMTKCELGVNFICQPLIEFLGL